MIAFKHYLRGWHLPSPCENKKEAMSIVIPVQQDTVNFDGYPVIGVRLLDGRIGASLRDMCDAMKIERARKK